MCKTIFRRHKYCPANKSILALVYLALRALQRLCRVSVEHAAVQPLIHSRALELPSCLIWRLFPRARIRRDERERADGRCASRERGMRHAYDFWNIRPDIIYNIYYIYTVRTFFFLFKFNGVPKPPCQYYSPARLEIHAHHINNSELNPRNRLVWSAKTIRKELKTHPASP